MNPFGEMQVTKPQASALSDIASSREVAEVQAAVILAKKFPRDQIEATDRILVACQRPTLAETALYSYSRGGTEITGPSIRLAEAIAQAWGNVQFGLRELDQRNGESTVESYCWDLETNTRQSKVFQVKHERHSKKGKVNLTDPRDIYETVANQGARRLRACILGVIPGDVVEAAVNQCEETLKSKADTSPDAMKKMVEAFASYGVTREQIEKRIQRRLDSITPAQVIGLRKIFNSLKDGMSSASDWFDAAEGDAPKETGSEGLKQALKKQRATKAQTQARADAIIQNVEAQLAEPELVDCPKSGDRINADWCQEHCSDKNGCPALE